MDWVIVHTHFVRSGTILLPPSFGRIAANEVAGIIRPYFTLPTSFGRIAANEVAGIIRPYFRLH